MKPLHRALLQLTTLILGWAPAAFGQAGTPTFAPLPARLDTATAFYGKTAIGRGVTSWTRVGDEHRQVYVWLGADGSPSTVDSLFSDSRTLRTLREVRVVGDTVITALFLGDSIQLSMSGPKGRPSVRMVAVGAPTYSSAAIEMLAAGMSLETGATLSLPTYYAPPARLGLRTTTLRVEERVDLDGRGAWKVRADTPRGGTTFWVDGATRAVLRTEVREGDALITFRR